MLIYTGTALAMALVLLIWLRMSIKVPSANPRVVLPTLHAQGYGVVGIGATTLVVAAGFDELWHRTIGDLTIWSPPHVMGVVGGIIIGLGTMIALLHASHRQILPPGYGQIGILGIEASVLISAYFGLVPGAVMAFTPQGESYRFFTTQDPYFVAVVASAAIPAIVTGTRRVSGRHGFELAAVLALGLWCLQEAYHQVATPLVADVFRYVVRHPYGLSNLRLNLLVLGFMLMPPLMVNRLTFLQPLLAGGLIAELYAAGVALWLAAVGVGRGPSILALAVIITLGAISSKLGTFCGYWIRRVGSAGNGP